MAEPLISVEDYQARLGHDLAGGLATRAESTIEDASAEVRSHANGLLDTVEPPDVPPLIVTVMMSIVRRALANPLARSGEAIDGHQWQAGGQTGVFATELEIKRIRRAVGVPSVGSAQMEGYMPLYPSVLGHPLDDTLSDVTNVEESP